MSYVIIGPCGSIQLRDCVVNTAYMQGWNRKFVDLTHLSNCQWSAVSAYLVGTSSEDVLRSCGNEDAVRSVAQVADEIGLVNLRNAAHMESLVRTGAVRSDSAPDTWVPMLGTPGFQVETHVYGGFRVSTLFVTPDRTIRPTEYSRHYPYSGVLLTCESGTGLVVFTPEGAEAATFEPGAICMCSTLSIDCVPDGGTFLVRQM